MQETHFNTLKIHAIDLKETETSGKIAAKFKLVRTTSAQVQEKLFNCMSFIMVQEKTTQIQKEESCLGDLKNERTGR